MSPVAISLIAFIFLVFSASGIHLIETAVSARKQSRP